VRDAHKGEPWAARGAEVAIASLDDPAALERALGGAEGAYLLSPPDVGASDVFGETRRRFAGIAHAIRAAKLPHAVLLSSVGAEHESGTGPIVSLHLAEQLLAAATALTAVRPGYFQENWAMVLPIAKQDGVLPSFVPGDVRVPTVATEDIGRVAAEALIDGPRGQRVIELAGPEEVTPEDVARAASAALGRPVQLAVQPLSAAVATFTAFGVSEHVAELYREMYAWIGSGASTPAPGSAIVRGRVGIREGIARLVERL
jgi:uncharacterized protein YbjT (DUF2867 family)